MTSTPAEILPEASEYACSQCGADDLKLWRLYQTMACNVELMCARCLGVEGVDETGRKLGTDQIASWMVPAVPHADTFWGYTSVPKDAVDWWRSRPTYKPASPVQVTNAARLKLAERVINYVRSTIPCDHPPSATCSHSRSCRLVHQWESLAK